MTAMAGVDDWLAVAEADADELRERILTGYKSGKPFTPYVPTVALPAVHSVLDFGCGLGRNFPYLTTLARRVDGFDLSPMIARCRELAPESSISLSDDWPDMRRRRYDLVFASLVLQHIDTAAISTYVADFSRIAPYIYVLTRARTDFDANVLDLIAKTGEFDVEACTAVDHDPIAHQLRVVTAISIEDARRAPDGTHYELLLRSRQ